MHMYFIVMIFITYLYEAIYNKFLACPDSTDQQKSSHLGFFLLQIHMFFLLLEMSKLHTYKVSYSK